MPDQPLLVATGNPGKVREFRELLRDIPYRLTDLREQGIADGVDETGATFAENARIKAEAYARRSGLPTLAEDSGLEVDALGGAPGVYSARYGGPGLSDADRVDLLLRNLAGVPWERRTARFRSVIALAVPGREVTLVEGVVEGRITFEPRGSGGFGYDPIFYVPHLGKTTAELDLQEKNRVSHRARAARQAAALLRAWAPGETSNAAQRST